MIILLLPFMLLMLGLSFWATRPLIAGAWTIQNFAKILVLNASMVLCTLCLYAFLGHAKAWQAWQNQGRDHYQLMTEVQALGGFSGLIQGIKTKLAENPNDVQGWRLLAKLYAAHGDTVLANEALEQAKKVEQNLPQ